MVQIKILIKTVISKKNLTTTSESRAPGADSRGSVCRRHWETLGTLVLVCLQRALCEVWWRPGLLASLTSEASAVSPGQQVSGQNKLL